MRLRTEPDGSALFEVAVRSARQPGVQRAQFVFFADAGSQGSRYRIWLPAPGAALPRNDSLFAFATESRSRSGNVSGSISDGDASTFVVTFDGRPQVDAWFAVSSPTPVELPRVSFAHGQTFHDGGWFDATAGKPEIQIQREKDGPWETVFVDVGAVGAILALFMARIYNTAKSTLALRQRKQFLLSQLLIPPDSLRASLVERFSHCGKTNCHCHHGGGKHGPFYYLTQCLAVGRVNKFLLKTAAQQQTARSAIAHYRQFQEHLEELSQINAQLLRREEDLSDD